MTHGPSTVCDQAAPPVARESGIPAGVLRASLRSSIKDAVAWSFMQGAGTNYLTPFLVLGGRGLGALAAFAGLPLLAGALVQWAAVNMTDALGRRNRVIVLCALFQALTWIPLCLAVLMPPQSGYWLMLPAFAVFTALANFGQPAWQSLMGDLVPPDQRGRYFGLRNFLSGTMLVASFFGAGWWLTLLGRRDTVLGLGLPTRDCGFLVLFAAAGAARLVSAWYLSRVHEPPYCPTPADRFSILEFIRRAPRAHFGRFVFYCALMNAGTGFVGPFFGWYLLDQLRFSPGAFAAVMTASHLLSIGSQPLWGRLADRIGSKRVLAIGGLGQFVIPLLLMLCQGFWPFVVVLAYDGLVTGAYTIASNNYFYDVVSPPKRARCIAFYNLFIALGTTVGAFAGAAVGWAGSARAQAGWLGGLHPFMLLLACSAVFRLLPNLLLRSFAEFRVGPSVFVGSGCGGAGDADMVSSVGRAAGDGRARSV